MLFKRRANHFETCYRILDLTRTLAITRLTNANCLTLEISAQHVTGTEARLDPPLYP